MAVLRPRVSDPFLRAGDFQRLFDVMFESTADRGRQAQTTHFPIDVYEDGDYYFVFAVIPGITPDRLEVTALGDVLTLSGDAEIKAPEGAKAVWHEINPMRFRRSVQLPKPFNVEKIEAQYENGVLQLRVPKAEEAKPRTIRVVSNGSK